MEVSRRVIQTVIAAIVFGVLIGLIVFQESRGNQSVPQSVFSKPRALPAFQLVDQHGKSFNNQSLEGQWSLVFFGFTHCPAVCPKTLADLNLVLKQTHKDSRIEQQPKVLFITVDPKRDTPIRLQQYLYAFNPHFLGIRGSEDEISFFTKQMGILVQAKRTGGKDYDIDHSGTVLLMDPKGQLAASFSPPFHTQTIIDDLAYLQKHGD